ncbi:hypothetical protein QCM11_20 [Bacillus phage QCM11]|uniref:Uncharacterized protein n=1 Tax=Bacillus phage QCM11 TaxID=1909400 RepID=A0A1I9S6N5_9CAUD|nr:hypothetical protein H3008_gp20 [Bacillus phage QCM11]AOZ62229.1 hypothetical protein QCM11_20 [Bacillus phage QCM11]
MKMSVIEMMVKTLLLQGKNEDEIFYSLCDRGVSPVAAQFIIDQYI